jgi:hypothetical protein
VGKTYEALKRAEAERKAKEARLAKDREFQERLSGSSSNALSEDAREPRKPSQDESASVPSSDNPTASEGSKADTAPLVPSEESQAGAGPVAPSEQKAETNPTSKSNALVGNGNGRGNGFFGNGNGRGNGFFGNGNGRGNGFFGNGNGRGKG